MGTETPFRGQGFFLLLPVGKLGCGLAGLMGSGEREFPVLI